MKLAAFIALAICALSTGCTDQRDKTEPLQASTARTSTVTYVCVGMEYSSRFGSCPGCKKDSERMNSFLGSKYEYKGSLLQSKQATKDAVVKKIKEAVSSTSEDGLFIFYYSGHGGREYLGSKSTSEPSGADSEDEYLCLYDTYLLDDELWEMISKCKGRVFLIFDCCHSQTMFRSVKSDVLVSKGLAVPQENFIVKSSGFWFKQVALPQESGGIRMLCWSGCMEKEYSYGGEDGGVMTNSMLSRWRNGITYTDLWKYIEVDVTKMQPTQHPKSTQYGSGFKKEAFR